MNTSVELWNGLNDKGKPALLTDFLWFCWKIDWTLHNTPFNPEASGFLKENSKDFSRPFSDNVVTGLAQAWQHLSKITVAEKSYEELSEGCYTKGAEERFIPMAPTLRWFWMGIENDFRATEAKKWLLAIGWHTILKQAEERDAATRLVLAGHATFFGFAIEETPAYTRAKKKADALCEEAIKEWARSGCKGPSPIIGDYLQQVLDAAA